MPVPKSRIDSSRMLQVLWPGLMASVAAGLGHGLGQDPSAVRMSKTPVYESWGIANARDKEAETLFGCVSPIHCSLPDKWGC